MHGTNNIGQSTRTKNLGDPNAYRTSRVFGRKAITLVAGLAIGLAWAETASAQTFQVVAETGDSYTIGSTTWSSGAVGVPSLSAPISSTGHWNLAVRSSNHFFGSAGDRVIFFSNSGVPLDQYSISASDDSLPSAQFNRAAYLTSAGVYSGTSLLAPHYSLGFFFGRPSAQGAFVAGVEWPVDTLGSSGIVVNGPSGSSLLVNSASESFDFLGRVTGPNAASDISFGRGGGGNVVFRGHHATLASRNGIYAKYYDGTRPTVAIADNTMANPLGGTFNFSSSTWERLPVAQGTGAAWTDASGTGVLSRPDVNNPIKIASQGLGTYGNVSAASAGMLAYEVDPSSGGATQIYQNLMGVETLAVDRTMITRRTVLDINMGSEALVANHRPLSRPSAGGFTLGFHAYQLNPHTEHAVYVKNIQQSGIDLGGIFGADVHDFGPVTAQFSVKGGGTTGGGSPEESDFITVTGRDDWGHSLQLHQTYGSGLGVSSGTPADDPSRLNSNGGASESLQLSAVYDMMLDGITFTGLDVGESVRFLLNGTTVQTTLFEGNQVTMMSGLQYVDLGSLMVPAGSYFAIEHGGGSDDGFAVSSVILGVIPSPGALSLLGLGGLLATRRRR